MKKLAALFLAVFFSCLSVGYAEQAFDACSCSCCQDKASVENDDDNTDDKPMTYLEWLDLAFPMVQNCYNLSTWVKAGNSKGYDPDRQGQKWQHEDVRFLLLDDIRCASAEQIEIMYRVGRETSSNDPKYIVNTYKFIHRVPGVCEMLRAMHAVVNMPDEYLAIDSLMMNVIEQIENLRDNLVVHITENGTMENWENNVPTLKNDMEKLKLLFMLVD